MYTPAGRQQQQRAAQTGAYTSGNDLQFYSSASSNAAQQHAAGYYQSQGTPQSDSVQGAIGSSRLHPSAAATTTAGQQRQQIPSFTGPIIVANWYNAFTPWTGTDSGEPPLLQELGVNFDHILQKSLAVLNPLRTVDSHIMDDADLAGPLVFCSVFASFLLLSGKPQFSYIYGVALVGSASIYALLNLMSENGIDAYRTASVLGYCLLPLVLLSMISVVASLDGMIGYIASSVSIVWCSYAASSIFSSVLHLSSQRLLVAYPVGLLYVLCFPKEGGV
ncbi:hypothetical protein OIV83_006424 [Microbotryomycetes sp. JL201]|nr:hypothetical protein OIV83_006424 [Microbotryomycetes sp. JL201]